MKKYAQTSQKGQRARRVGWWRDNWRWMRIGVVGLIFVGLLGCIFGWWQVNTDLGWAMPTAPMQQHVEVKDLMSKKLVALTFDDGPSGVTTPGLLNILKEKNVRVTFFTLGTMVQNNPDLIKREFAEGHEVASHTMRHKQLNKLSDEAVRTEVNEAKQAITAVLGEGNGANLMRPPYGAINNTVRKNAGAPLIIWTVDTLDWKSKDAKAVVAETESNVFDGAIILMHDIYQSTIEAVGTVIDDLRRQGYEFVTVSEMAKLRGVTLQNGETYGSIKK